jgi:DNA-binding transcriptional LysR family regulator
MWVHPPTRIFLMNNPRLGQVWNWLPAFRAVAESQHLPTASREVHLSASALSRSVRQLEDQLERQLFQREGRSLALSPAGRALLSAVRDAMRRVDDALSTLGADAMSGPLRISASGPYASVFVLPAVQEITRAHPSLVPHLDSLGPTEINQRLHEGSLDLALVDRPVVDDEIVVHLLGRLTSGIYAAPHHPLARRPSLAIADVLRHPFVAPPPTLNDGWPPHLARHVAMVVSQLHVAVQACASGDLLALIPDFIAEAYRGDGALVRLPVALGPSSNLYAVHRPALSFPSRVLVLRDAIEVAVHGASQRSLRGSVQPPEAFGIPSSETVPLVIDDEAIDEASA